MLMQTEIVGTGAPLILVPGGLTGWLSWIPHAERLSKSRKVVRVQLLNVQFGLENKPLPPDYSVTTESRALSETLDSLQLEKKLDLVAWSYGAETTLDYALGHAERVRSLTLIEPPAFWVLRAEGPLDHDTKGVIAGLETLTGDISEGQLEQFAKTVGLLSPSQSGRDLSQWPVWMKHRLSLRNSPAAITHSDDPRRLEKFQPPVLLVKGTGSARFLHNIIDAMARRLPDAEVIELPAGHAPQLVSMDRFLEKLVTFQAGANGRRK
jgi:pimeloyl-ACP methyl ester carboxylesterase